MSLLRTLRIIALVLGIAGTPAVASQSLPDVTARELVDAAVAQTRTAVTYDGSYRRIPYPGGDVPANIGVCTHVAVRRSRTYCFAIPSRGITDTTRGESCDESLF